MNPDDKQVLNKARTTAVWSYLGIVIPLIGFILAGLSLSSLKSIETQKSQKFINLINDVKRIAVGGIIASSICLLIYLSLGLWPVYKYYDATHVSKSECVTQVKELNNKIKTLNKQYSTPKYTAYTSENDNVTDTNNCERNGEQVIADTEKSLGLATEANKNRCEDWANQLKEKIDTASDIPEAGFTISSKEFATLNYNSQLTICAEEASKTEN